MEIVLAKHQGFCYGVKRAVDMAQTARNDDGVYTLGPIIHNPQVVKRLEVQKIKAVNAIEDVGKGTLIIRSHGVGPDVYKEAQEKGLTLFDATCPHVKKAQMSAKELADQGLLVAVIGERNHPEVKSIVAWAGENAIVVENEQEAEAVPFSNRIGVVAQTTFSTRLFDVIISILKKKCYELTVRRTICNATELRQQSARELAARADVMIVVGGKNSANTARLAQVCKEAGCRTYLVETAEELKPEWFEGVAIAGITAGASTPDWIIEEVYKKMQELDAMLNAGVKALETGSIIKGQVVGIQKDSVFVNVGYKAEGIIQLEELAYPAPGHPAEVVKEGDIINVFVVDAESSDGVVRLSKLKADKIVAWDKLEEALNEGREIEVKAAAVIKGGLEVSVFGIRGFIPASQVDVKYVNDLSEFVGKTLSVTPIEIDRQKQKVVLSRRKVLELARAMAEEKLFAELKEGQIVRGTVKRIAGFGAFIDIGGVDGLAHISDLSWERVKSPEEVVQIGDEVEALVLKVDYKTRRIGLSLKQITKDPWYDLTDELTEGMTVKGKVTKTAKMGAFVEIKKGVEGLVHISELSSDRHVNNVSEIVEPGQKVNVKILGIDKKHKRISLSIAKAQEEAQKAEFSQFIDAQKPSGFTIGDKFGHLFKREN